MPETVLGTKEASEKTRLAAFDLLIVMGQKMSEEGIIKRNEIDGMDEDDMDGRNIILFIIVD